MFMVASSILLSIVFFFSTLASSHNSLTNKEYQQMELHATTFCPNSQRSEPSTAGW